MNQSAPDEMAGWFLGPKAENAAVEREIILRVLEDYFRWRRDCYPQDPPLIDERMRAAAAGFHERLRETVEGMLAGLRRDFPFSSPRYIAHMLSDQTMPAVIGYFAGLLYNPNNVTPESSPVTLDWELEVGADILRMLGFEAPPGNAFGWAHISSGGTVANLEALWVARNVRYFPLAAADVCRRHGIPLAVASLRPEACLALPSHAAVALHAELIEAVREHYCLARSEAARVTHELLGESRFSIAHHGTCAAYGLLPPVIVVSGARHYSITKAADLLGIGRDHVVLVDVDHRFRMDMVDLEAKLRQLKQVPLAVVAIAGTTEEGAVDPVHRIHELRGSAWLHIDAAWGGYLRSLFTPACDIDDVRRFVSRDGLAWGDPDVCEAFAAFPKADSITVDPHKLGYIPYPCGVAAYRDDRVRHFLTQEIPYLSDVHHEDASMRPPASVGPYILEGSKPGSAVAACWLSHRMIPPNRSGYGRILRGSLLAAVDFYMRLCRRRTAGLRLIPITAQPPDTNVVCFLAQTDPPGDLAFINRLNRHLFDSFTHRAHGELPPFFLSRTVFQPASYSTSAIGSLLERASIDPADYRLHGLFVLRATLMSPYLNMEAEEGKPSHLDEFFECFEDAARVALAHLGHPLGFQAQPARGEDTKQSGSWLES